MNSGKKKPRIIGMEDVPLDDAEGDGPVLVTDDRAIREGGKLDVADYSVMASTAHGEGAVSISPDEFSELSRQATEVHAEFLDLIRRGMKLRHARYVRALRLEDYSWRSIARLCYERKWEWGTWAPPNNQLAGMALCERAAELHSENYRVKPWN